MSLDARVTARLVGETALAGLLLATAGVAAWAPMPAWLKLVVFIPTLGAPTFMVVAAALRHLQGGASDVEVVDGPRRFSVTSLRFGDLAATMTNALAWHRRPPLAMPAGRLIGNPADPASVQPGNTALPADVTVATVPLQIPEGAETIEGAPEQETSR